MFKLYIEDTEVDLSGDESISFDFAIFDIDDIGGRKGALSIAFDLPMTAVNRKVYESPQLITGISSVPYRKLKARAIKDGIDLGFTFCELQQVDSMLKIRLFGSNSNFYGLIKGLNVSDLAYLKALDHIWAYSNIIASLGNETGYIYPIVDFHSDSPNAYISNANTDIFCQGMLPMLFVDEIIEQIVKDAGYTYSNQLTSQSIYNTTRLLFGYYDGRCSRVNADRYNVQVGNSAYTFISSSVSYVQCVFDTDIIPGTSAWLAATLPVYDTINCPDKIKCDINLHLVLRRYESDSVTILDQDCKFRISLQSGAVLYESSWLTFPYPPPTTYNEQIFDIALTGIEIPAGDKLIVSGIDEDTSPSPINFIRMNEGTTLELSNVEIVDSSTLVYNDALYGLVAMDGFSYKYKQSDILKDYCNMYGLIIVVDEVFKQVRLVQFDTIRNNINNALDWSDKIDETEYAEIFFRADGYGQINNYLYASEDGVQKPVGADGSITIADEWLEPSTDAVELKAGVTNSVNRLVDITINKIGVIEVGEVKNKTTNRFVLMHRESGSVVIKSGGVPSTTITTDIPFTSFIDPSLPYDLGFQTGLLPNYHTSIDDVLNSYKKVRQPMRLNASDINQLDYTRPIWLSKYGCYFYISAIKNYDALKNDSCIVELIKLPTNG